LVMIDVDIVKTFRKTEGARLNLYSTKPIRAASSLFLKRGVRKVHEVSGNEGAQINTVIGLVHKKFRKSDATVPRGTAVVFDAGQCESMLTITRCVS